MTAYPNKERQVLAIVTYLIVFVMCIGWLAAFLWQETR